MTLPAEDTTEYAPELENARPLQLQLWSDRPEVNAATEAIFKECAAVAGIKRQHQRMKDCLKVVLLNLFTTHAADPSQYVRYARRNVTLIKRYNVQLLSNEQIEHAVDNLVKLAYAENTLGRWSPDKEKRRQSRVRATDALIARMKAFGVTPLMAATHVEASTIILKDADKLLMEYEPTEDTCRMQLEMAVINKLLSETFVSLYMPDAELYKLKERMRTGKVPELEPDLDEDDEDETPRGSIDLTSKSLRRIFNNSSFVEGGRLYGGWWQGIPRDYRKYIRINRMNTVELDFSAFHISLIYWLEGLPVPEEDLYTLEGFPEGTRQVVKQCLLTMINAKDRKEAMASINQKIRGYKTKRTKVEGVWQITRKNFHEKDMIVLPAGIKKVDKIIKAFEKKHEPIKKWFFSGKGRTLQYQDSQIAVEILLILAKQEIPALPLHDSFIVVEPYKTKLEKVMVQAYHIITGRYPKLDSKDSLTEENTLQGIQKMDEHYRAKMDNGTYSKWFRRKYSNYVGNYEEWKQLTGTSTIKTYSRISATYPAGTIGADTALSAVV
jgi:hypothetical protein